MKQSLAGGGRLPSHIEVEQLIMAWINDLRSNEISARVTTSSTNHKAVELHPVNVDGTDSPTARLARNI